VRSSVADPSPPKHRYRLLSRALARGTLIMSAIAGISNTDCGSGVINRIEGDGQA
jgi:hypothetical protein